MVVRDHNFMVIIVMLLKFYSRNDTKMYVNKHCKDIYNIL